VVERRQAPRIPLHSVGTIDLGDREVPCQLIELSSKGMSLLTPEHEPPRGPVRVRFQLGRRDAGWTEIDARVLRVEGWDEASSLWGLELFPLEPGPRRHVQAFVARS
jgi:hypothetical protein